VVELDRNPVAEHRADNCSCLNGAGDEEVNLSEIVSLNVTPLLAQRIDEEFQVIQSQIQR
jgi:hypothetical protein